MEILKASKILESKGFQQPKFDTVGFTSLVGKYFTEHEVKDTLLLVPKRFINMTEPPKGGFEDYTDVSIWERRCEDPNDPFSFTDYIIARNKCLIRPMVYVDEPFIKNAAFTLSAMCGFVVKKQRAGKFLVSLV